MLMCFAGDSSSSSSASSSSSSARTAGDMHEDMSDSEMRAIFGPLFADGDGGGKRKRKGGQKKKKKPKNVKEENEDEAAGEGVDAGGLSAPDMSLEDAVDPQRVINAAEREWLGNIRAGACPECQGYQFLNFTGAPSTADSTRCKQCAKAAKDGKIGWEQWQWG